MKRTGVLERKTPLRKKAARKRRPSILRCAHEGCRRSPRVFVPTLEFVVCLCLVHAKREADRLCRAVVLARDGCRCVACGRTSDETELDWAHIIRRSQSDALHWDPDNGLALCRTDHDRFDDSETPWRAWLDENRPGLWEALNVKRLEAIRAGSSPDYAEIIASLRSQAAGLVR